MSDEKGRQTVAEQSEVSDINYLVDSLIVTMISLIYLSQHIMSVLLSMPRAIVSFIAFRGPIDLKVKKRL